MNAGDWNEAIAAWFFRTEMADKHVYLSVDDDTIEAIAERLGLNPRDGVASFEGAIRAETWSGSDPFKWWRGQVSAWRGGGKVGTLPAIGLLAATVLAASRMVVEGGVGAPNYYNQLTSIMAASDGWDHEKYRHFVPDMWSELEWWLDGLNGGRRGKSTAWSNETHNQHIGYSLSQALLLGADRERLCLFFDELDLKPGSEMEGRELVARLKEWDRRGGHLPKRLRESLDDPELSQRLGCMIAAELADWDGSIRDVRGLEWSRLVLTIDMRHGEFGFAARVSEEDRGQNIEVDGEVIATERYATYAKLERAVDVEALRGGIKLAGKRQHNYRYEPKSVIPFINDDELGRWRSVSRAELGVPHCILARNDTLPAVRCLLDEIGTSYDTTSKVRIPAGWTVLKRVLLRAGPQVVDNPALRALIPAPSELPALVGGLRINSHGSVYLCGGAPDLLVPGLTTEQLLVELDGESVARVGAEGRLISLQALPLRAGRHELQVGSTRLSFQLEPQILEQRALPPILGHHLIASEGSYFATGPARLVTAGSEEYSVVTSGAAIEVFDSGAGISEPIPPMMIKHAPRGYVGMGQPGRIATLDVCQPQWIRDVNLSFGSFEVEDHEVSAGWDFLFVARRFTSKVNIVFVGRVALEPPPSPYSHDVRAWAARVCELAQLPIELSSATDVGEQQWFDYIGIAREVVGDAAA